eukprot:1125001-Prymnesium_polylepis.1
MTLSPILQPAFSAADPACTLLMVLSADTRSPKGAFHAEIDRRISVIVALDRLGRRERRGRSRAGPHQHSSQRSDD